MNEFLWVGMLLSTFVLLLVTYRLLGAVGLISWVAIATIIANLQVLKVIELFGLTVTLGNILYSTSFLATDILSENHGPRYAKRAVWIGFLANVSLIGLMNLSILFQPGEEDFVHQSFTVIFRFMPRIGVASLVAYLVSQFLDVRLYHFLKQKSHSWRSIWLRNNVSTLISQLVDSTLFTFLAFWGRFSLATLSSILITTYLLKWLVALLDTPLVYLANYWKRRGRVENSSSLPFFW